MDSETGPYAYLLNIRIALFYRYNYVYLIPKIFFVSIECIRDRPAPLYINAVDNLELWILKLHVVLPHNCLLFWLHCVYLLSKIFCSSQVNFKLMHNYELWYRYKCTFIYLYISHCWYMSRKLLLLLLYYIIIIFYITFWFID